MLGAGGVSFTTSFLGSGTGGEEREGRFWKPGGGEDGDSAGGVGFLMGSRFTRFSSFFAVPVSVLYFINNREERDAFNMS